MSEMEQCRVLNCFSKTLFQYAFITMVELGEDDRKVHEEGMQVTSKVHSD